LDKFFANPLPGSVCLLDDYGHNGFEDTRLEIDDWISKRDDFLALEIFPTGQAAIVAY